MPEASPCRARRRLDGGRRLDDSAESPALAEPTDPVAAESRTEPGLTDAADDSAESRGEPEPTVTFADSAETRHADRDGGSESAEDDWWTALDENVPDGSLPPVACIIVDDDDDATVPWSRADP